MGTKSIAALVISLAVVVGAGVALAIAASALSSARAEEAEASRTVAAARADRADALESLQEAQVQRALAEVRAESGRVTFPFGDGPPEESSAEYEQERAEAAEDNDVAQRAYESSASAAHDAIAEARAAAVILDDAESSYPRTRSLVVASAIVGLFVAGSSLVVGRQSRARSRGTDDSSSSQGFTPRGSPRPARS